jgi:hypothetical protein
VPSSGFFRCLHGIDDKVHARTVGPIGNARHRNLLIGLREEASTPSDRVLSGPTSALPQPIEYLLEMICVGGLGKLELVRDVFVYPDPRASTVPVEETSASRILNAPNSRTSRSGPSAGIGQSRCDLFRERLGTVEPDAIGGPGRTRTCNQTVMSGG